MKFIIISIGVGKWNTATTNWSEEGENEGVERTTEKRIIIPELNETIHWTAEVKSNEGEKFDIKLK